MKILFFLVALLPFASGIFLFAEPAHAQSASSEVEITNPAFQIDLPGSAFKEIEEGGVEQGLDPETGRRYLIIEWIALYLGGIYKLMLFSGSILAVIIIMGAGFAWITAAGNTGMIEKAKEYIKGALTGLILLMCTTLILFTVNPGLVNLKGVKVIVPLPAAYQDSCEAILDNFPTQLQEKKVTIVLDSIGKEIYSYNDIPPNVCGESAQIKNTGNVTAITRNACIFSSAKICKCSLVTDEILRKLNYPENNASCSKFEVNLEDSSSQEVCRYNSGWGTGCYLENFDCSKNGPIQSCEDYNPENLDQFDGENDEGYVCKKDPCKRGPCKYETKQAGTSAVTSCVKVVP